MVYSSYSMKIIDLFTFVSYSIHSSLLPFFILFTSLCFILVDTKAQR